jgi:hypothetical protein
VPHDDALLHPDQPRFLFSAWVWAVALFLCFGVIVAITFGAMHRGSNYENERSQARTEKLKTAREEWEKTANTYGWVDKAKGVAHVPIARAMELELNDLQARKPAPAGPIATPAPATVPVTATGAAQPNNPPATAPAPTSPTPKPISVEGPNSEIRGQPTGAANPPNAHAGTQPGPNATPAAKPQSHTEVPPVSPTTTPIQHAPGTPHPVRGNGQMSPPPPKPRP